LAVKIDEPQADRRRTLRSIRSIERDFPPFLETDGDRPRLVGAIQRLENVLDEYYAALWDTNEGQHRRYADLRAELEQLSDVTRTKLHRDYRNDCASPADEDELQALLEEIERLKELVVECSYLENPWSACIGAEQITSTALEDLRACLDRALEQAAGLTWWGLRFIRQANLVWLAEHPWMGDWGTSFLPIDVRESHEAFARIACDLRNWAREHHADSSKVIDTIRRSPKPADAIRAFADRVGQLPTIAEIHGRRHDMAPVDSLWHRIEIRQVDLWAHHLRAAAYRKWWENLEKRRPRLTTSAARIRDWRGELRQSVERKRDLDQLLVRGRYRERLSPRNRLEDLDLLRINSAQGRPRTTLRNLYARGFESLHRLYPVLLTNPDHVSSLLPLEAAKYDLLIMDEASQVFMADAMPALYRAKRAIICGDQMQMPPSDFFSPGMGMGDDFEEETDAEDGTQPADLNRLVPAEGEYCLLDAAVHAVREGSPDNVRLRVHYRSEAKELVDFSNHAFYDGGLLIPPGNWVAPSFLTTPIQLQHVGGTCEGGVNGDEALGVVRVLKEKIWLDNDSPSVGVIAFNIKQAERIEDVLFEKSMQDDDFRGRLECERARRGEGGEDESFFVRSVEHVQGDERDIIIFSTTYGPGSHSFGPISNKEKGRRRLNVAVTRAKRGIIVLTSLDIDRISNDDEQEQRERYYFWKYLCYARAVSNGRREEMRAILNAFRAQGAAVGGEAESPFEADVAAYLRRQGYQVDYQVGEGGFRIDLGVKRRPEDPRYLCGVECDGRAYHREWSARLYDVWRQGILEKKGWKIVRVWSTDWFNNPQPSRERLLREMG
jgi:very-short-patch-repair endonuclease